MVSSGALYWSGMIPSNPPTPGARVSRRMTARTSRAFRKDGEYLTAITLFQISLVIQNDSTSLHERISLLRCRPTPHWIIANPSGSSFKIVRSTVIIWTSLTTMATPPNAMTAQPIHELELTNQIPAPTKPSDPRTSRSARTLLSLNSTSWSTHYRYPSCELRSQDAPTDRSEAGPGTGSSQESPPVASSHPHRLTCGIVVLTVFHSPPPCRDQRKRASEGNTP